MHDQLALFPQPDPTIARSARTCRYCGAAVRPHTTDSRAWEHTGTGRIRCTSTTVLHVATPDTGQLTLPLTGTEAA